MTKEFYITLVSNSSLEYYPENKTNSFTTQLPQYVMLDGEWSVALVELQFPFTLFNVTKENNKIVIIYDVDNKSEIEITTGYYSDLHELIKAINNQVKKYVFESFIELDVATQRIRVNKNPEKFNTIAKTDLVSVCFENRLAMQLGFEPGANILDYELSPHAANINLGIPELMVIYCDIVDGQILGDKFCKMLRVINTASGKMNFAQFCNKEFNFPHYIKLQSKKFETITLDIRDTSAKPMPFQFGTLTVKLHFRQE